MAEQVARLKILAQIEGLEGFDKLKGAFKGLQQAIGPSDQQLSKARKEILAFGEAGTRTEQVLRGQVEALKALQGQATVGGAAYRQLSKDIKTLGGAYREAATGVKQFSDAQLKSQFPAAKPEAFARQIAAFKRDLQQLSVFSSDYSAKLTEIQQRQIPFDAALGRQNVIANARVYAQGNNRNLPELPDTTAALNQRLTEASQKLANLTRNGEDWIRVSREIAKLQRELNREFANPAVDAARKRLEQSRNTSSGFLAFSSGLEDRLAVQRSIARNAAKRGPAPIELPMMETSDLYRSIQGVGLSRIGSQLELMGNSYEQVASDIRKATAASDGSINSLRSQRASWEALRNSLGDNKVALKEVNRELAAIDKQLERRVGGAGGIGPKIQAAGAIASGAIFGGPIGAIGGLVGAGVGAATGIGAVGGSFAGAAIGGALGSIQQSAANAANYTAEISRLRIALKGVSTDQVEFNNSLKFISQSSGQFLTSLGDATKNYTRLQASVRGAGLGVDDTQKVFKGLSAAIIATGGGTEEMNAAMLAASQVFSKGKVSAEELRGQIGERLPGAFTIFAQAVKMTPQQLDKALQEGKVTTQQFVQFSEELFKRYKDSAKAIGDSPFAASIRFELAMKNMQLAAGQALLPIATYFTNLGTDALNGLTRIFEGTTNWQKAINNAFTSVSKLIGGVAGLKNILSGLTKTMLVLGTTMGAVFAVQNIGTFATIFKTVVTATQTMVKVSRELLSIEKAITALKAIQAALEAVMTGALTKVKNGPKNAYIAGGIALAGGAIAATQFGKQIDEAVNGAFDVIGNKLDKLFKTPDLGGNFGGNNPPLPNSAEEDAKKRQQEADEQQRLNEATAKAQIEINNRIHQNAIELLRKRYEYERELQNQSAENWVKSYTGAARGAAGIITKALSDLEGLRGRAMESSFRTQSAQQGLRSAQALAAVTGGGAGGRVIEYLTGDRSHSGYRADHGGSNYHEHVAFETAQQMRDAMQVLQAAGIRIGSTTGGRHAANSYHYAGQAFDVPASQVAPGQEQELSRRVRAILAQAGYMGKGIGNAPANATQASLQRRNVGNVGEVAEAGANLAQANALAALDANQIARLRSLLKDSFVLDYTEQIREQTRELKNQTDIQELRNRLLSEGKSQEFIDGEVRKAEALQTFTAQLQPAQDKLDELRKKFAETKDVRLVDDIKLLEAAIAALKDQFPQLTEQLDKFLKKQKEGKDAAEGFKAGLTRSLQDYYKTLSDLGGSIGNVIQSSFKGLEDQLVNFVTTGKASFAELAQSILADMSRIAIQQAVIKPLLGATMGLFGIPLPSAKGNVFAQNGIQPFAMGGIVDRPTLFKFANGGAMNTGVMGEAGPEAVIPLRRGRDGKLGVSGGGGDTVVNVSVDASGSNVEGDPGRGQLLGRAVAQAVQAELIKQKRPGGLLAA